MATVDRSRRRFVGGLLLAGALLPLAAGVRRASAGPVSALYRAGAREVRLDYWTDDTFRLVPAIGAADTVVIAGAVHLVQRPSLLTGDTPEVIRIADLRTAVGAPTGPLAHPDGRLEVDAATILPGAEGRVRLAAHPALAHAQRAVGRLATSMDMTLCSGDVDTLTRWLKVETGDPDLAVVATPDGWTLAEASGAPQGDGPTLPPGIPVLDYRLPAPA